MSASDSSRSEDLALFEGGPFGGVLRSARLHGPALSDAAWRRALCLVCVTWLPLLALSALEGQALGGLAKMSFLQDASVHVRFLIALPLLILAEIGVDARIRPAPGTFVARGLVLPHEVPRLRAAVEHALRLRDAGLAEAVMLLGVFTVALWQWSGNHLPLADAAIEGSSWYVRPAADGGGRSLAGLWFAFVSLPLFQFLALRWYYRILIWTGLMWRTSRLDLQLLASHPDRAAGLGFLAQTVNAFVPLALAHGTMLSAVIVNRIFYAGAVLTDFRIEIVGMVLFVFLLVLAPLMVFVPTLVALNTKASAQYGALAGNVARTFEGRWIRDAKRPQGELLDVAEVSAMTDLDTTMSIVNEMHYVPVTRESLLWIGGAVLVPLLPLLLTMMPADELIKRVLGIFL